MSRSLLDSTGNHAGMVPVWAGMMMVPSGPARSKANRYCQFEATEHYPPPEHRGPGVSFRIRPPYSNRIGQAMHSKSGVHRPREQAHEMIELDMGNGASNRRCQGKPWWA